MIDAPVEGIEVAKRVVRVKASQVMAARHLVERKRKRGETVPAGLQAIADARSVPVVTPAREPQLPLEDARESLEVDAQGYGWSKVAAV